jgi:hypothetical protein
VIEIEHPLACVQGSHNAGGCDMRLVHQMDCSVAKERMAILFVVALRVGRRLLWIEVEIVDA